MKFIASTESVFQLQGRPFYYKPGIVQCLISKFYFFLIQTSLLSHKTSSVVAMIQLIKACSQYVFSMSYLCIHTLFILLQHHQSTSIVFSTQFTSCSSPSGTALYVFKNWLILCNYLQPQTCTLFCLAFGGFVWLVFCFESMAGAPFNILKALWATDIQNSNVVYQHSLIKTVF